MDEKPYMSEILDIIFAHIGSVEFIWPSGYLYLLGSFLDNPRYSLKLGSATLRAFGEYLDHVLLR
jgi:hypothetical protein